MQLPSKLFSYAESNLALMPPILERLHAQGGEASVEELLNAAKPCCETLPDFLHAMDCLYALGKINVTEEGNIYLC